MMYAPENLMNKRHGTLKVAVAVTLAVVGASIGCSSSGPAQHSVGLTSLSANNLGVESLDVQQQDANGLSMRGLDKDGNEVMSVKLTVGMIDYVADEGLDPQPRDGREIVFVAADGLTTTHQDPFRTPAAVVEPMGGIAAEFAAIPEVAAAIQEYGLTFNTRKAMRASNSYAAVEPQAIDFSSRSPAFFNVCTTMDAATQGGSYLSDIMCSDRNGNMHASERVFTGVCDSFGSPSGFHPVWNSSIVSKSSQLTGSPPYSSVYPCVMYSLDGDTSYSGGCAWDLWTSSTTHDVYPSVGYFTETGSYGAEGRTWGSVKGTCTCTHCSGTQPLDANNNACSCRTSATSPTNGRTLTSACVTNEECQSGVCVAADAQGEPPPQAEQPPRKGICVGTDRKH
jgi:hypothetical protein